MFMDKKNQNETGLFNKVIQELYVLKSDTAELNLNMLLEKRK